MKQMHRNCERAELLLLDSTAWTAHSKASASASASACARVSCLYVGCDDRSAYFAVLLNGRRLKCLGNGLARWVTPTLNSTKTIKNIQAT